MCEVFPRFKGEQINGLAVNWDACRNCTATKTTIPMSIRMHHQSPVADFSPIDLHSFFFIKGSKNQFQNFSIERANGWSINNGQEY